MEFHGFRSIKEYEKECARVGFSTRRVPFRKDGEKYFALITGGPKTATSIETWHLFTADESKELLDGVISGGAFMHAEDNEYGPGYMQKGVDVNYLGKLAAHGYYPEIPDSSAAESAPVPVLPLEIVEDGTGFSRFSLLPV